VNAPNLEDVADELVNAIRDALASQFGAEAAKTFNFSLGDSEEARAFLRDFCEFCRKGAFVVD
jgi:hypothetical protein